ANRAERGNGRGVAKPGCPCRIVGRSPGAREFNVARESLMPRKLAPDFWLFAVALVLLSTGVVMVYSASAIVAGDRFRDPYFFLKKQVFWAALGCAALWIALRTDYRRLEKLVLPLLALAAVLLVLVL